MSKEQFLSEKLQYEKLKNESLVREQKKSSRRKAPRAEYAVGDIVKLKKSHPCGSFEWLILRVGADFKLRCQGCGHEVMVARRMVEKNTKDIKKA